MGPARGLFCNLIAFKRVIHLKITAFKAEQNHEIMVY